MELTRRQSEIIRLALVRLRDNYDKVSISHGAMKASDEFFE